MSSERIGILGAGKLGITLAQLALKAEYGVYIAGSGPAEKISLTMSVLAPGAIVGTTKEVIEATEVIILALPLGKFRTLPAADFAGKLVIDAMNYWWEVDGERADIVPDTTSTSEAVQKFLPTAAVVKAFNHMGYHDLFDEARPAQGAARKAIAIAGDDTSAVSNTATIVDRLGFDPLPVGPLSTGRWLEVGQPAFGANLSTVELKKLLAEAGK